MGRSGPSSLNSYENWSEVRTAEGGFLHGKMASSSSSKLLFLRRLSRAVKLSSSTSSASSSYSFGARPPVFLLEASRPCDLAKNNLGSFLSVAFRSFCSRTLSQEDDSRGPASIDYRFVLFVNFSLCYSIIIVIVSGLFGCWKSECKWKKKSPWKKYEFSG